MKRRLLVGSAVVASILVVSGAAVVAARPDLRDHLRYELTSDDIGAPDITSVLPPIPTAGPTPIRIAVAGDVGTGGEAEYKTAAAMDDLENDSEYSALILLGDNVYPSGDPDQLDAAVFDPFAEVLAGGTQLLPVLGNHDVSDGNGDAHDAAAGYHGSSIDVRNAFSPLFERFGVQLVLAGHDHDYQRSPVDGVTYVVSGPRRSYGRQTASTSPKSHGRPTTFWTCSCGRIVWRPGP